MKRTNEPIFWSLFGAGGVVVAFILPVLIFITGIALPLGLLSEEALSYDRVAAFAGHLPGKIFILVVITLTLWHSAHRVFLSLHDLGVHQARNFFRWLCYGFAGVVTISTITLLAVF